MTPNEIFKANFHNPKLRKDFKDLSGLDAESNPAAYIAFINSVKLDMVEKHIAELSNAIAQLRR
jgi:hypothetical protein